MNSSPKMRWLCFAAVCAVLSVSVHAHVHGPGCQHAHGEQSNADPHRMLHATVPTSGPPLSAYVVAVDDNAPAQEAYAAEILARHIGSLLSPPKDLPIVEPSKAAGMAMVAVGSAAVTAGGAAPGALEGLGLEGYTILSGGELPKAAAGSIGVSGGVGAPRGAIYGAYEYLRQLGFRFWEAGVTQTPSTPPATLPPPPAGAGRFVPTLEYREMYEASYIHNPEFAVSQGTNRGAMNSTEGGSVVYAPPGFVHTSYDLVPPDKYFQSHPEWFAMRDGKRQSTNSQLCWTNASMVANVTATVKGILTANPDATIISVSQNDNQAYCQCPVCSKVNQEEGSPMGSLLRAVNTVADAIKSDFPNVAVDTLAYQYTRPAPSITVPRENVIIRLCSIECNFAAPLTDESNAPFQSDIKNWGKISNRTYIWNYVTDFAQYVAPFPNWYVLGPNVRFFAEHGVRGVFQEGTYGSVGGDMSPLKGYVLSRMLWDPTTDDDALITDFLAGYYGAAAPFIRDYMDLMHNSTVEQNSYMTEHDPVTAGFLTPAAVLKSVALMNSAAKAVANEPEVLARVKLQSLPPMYVTLLRWNEFKTWASGAGVAWPAGDSIQDAFDEFSAIYNAAGVKQLSEGGHDLAWLKEQVLPGVA